MNAPWPLHRVLIEKGNAANIQPKQPYAMAPFFALSCFFFLALSLIFYVFWKIDHNYYERRPLGFFMPDHSRPDQSSQTEKKIFDSFQKQFRKTPWFSPIVERVYPALPLTSALGLFHKWKGPFLMPSHSHSHRFPEILIDSMRILWISPPKKGVSPCVSTPEVLPYPNPVSLQLNKKIQEEKKWWTLYFLNHLRSA